jgi:3-hydroxy-9,10-secoandrosta-1,3,5(10)-triene-9,17-dione monooxygenase
MSTRGPVLVSADARIDRLERARALVPTLAARAAGTAEDRRVPDATIADFRAAGLFRILQPARFGGSELDFTVFSGATRELARGCASSAWVYAVIEEMSWVIAMFPEEAQVEIWGSDPQALACAALVPAGLAQREGDGWRLSGQWQFLSGIDHATWVFLTTTADNGMGGRELRNFLVPRDALEVIDDWHVLGLTGTGSKSVKADSIFVPTHRSILYDELLAGTAPGSRVHPHYPLCRTPRRYLTTFSITPVLVGLANRALDVTTDMLRSRLNAGAPPDEFEAVQQKLAECAAEVKIANLILDTGVRESVAAAAAGRAIGDKDVADNRLMTAYMVRLCRQAVERLAAISGSRFIFDSHPMQIILRDTIAGVSHRGFNWELNARVYSQSIGIARRDAPPVGP